MAVLATGDGVSCVENRVRIGGELRVGLLGAGKGSGLLCEGGPFFQCLLDIVCVLFHLKYNR